MMFACDDEKQLDHILNDDINITTNKENDNLEEQSSNKNPQDVKNGHTQLNPQNTHNNIKFQN